MVVSLEKSKEDDLDRGRLDLLPKQREEKAWITVFFGL